MNRYEDLRRRRAGIGEPTGDETNPTPPAPVASGDDEDTIHVRPAEGGLGSLDFGGHTNTPEGPDSADFANPQTLEEMEAPTPQPPSTGEDMADIAEEERGRGGGIGV